MHQGTPNITLDPFDENKRDYGALWRIEHVTEEQGGIVEFSEPIRLRHVM